MNVKFKIGLKENLPKTNIIEGSWYLCKDTGELYYGSSNDQMVLIDASTNLKTLEINANNGLNGGGEINSTNTILNISHKENTPTIEGNGLISDSGVVTDIEFDNYGHPTKVIKSELELSNFGINSSIDDLNVISKNIIINGITYKITRPISDNSQISEIFAPSTSGSLGQILVSAGNNEPEWSDLNVIIPESLAGTELPQVSNIANTGTSNKYAREDHVHPKASYTANEVGAIPEGGLKTINNQSLEGSGNIQTLQISDFENDFIKTSQIGKTNGVASLNESGIIPSDQLPSYVDDVIDVYAMYSKDQLGNLTNIKLYSDSAYKNEITKGESGKIYINIASGEPNYNFRWSGTSFNYLNTGGITIGEITGTAYDGKKGKDTTDKLNTHVLDYNNPHKVTKSQVGLENVDNTSDTNKPISTATQNALDEKLDNPNGTSSQFIKGDGSLDSTEYRPVIINNSKTTNTISRRDFLYTVANTNNGKTGTLVIEIPFASSRIYEFEVILGSYRYYHKPTSLFFHLYRDKNSNPNANCVCTKVGSLSYEDIRVAEKTDGQNFCILIGNVDSTWHHEIIRIPELVEDVNYLDTAGINIEATAYVTTDESVFSKISKVNTNSYYDPSSSLSMSANLWGNKLETGNEDFSGNSLFIKGSTAGNWTRGITINRTGDNTVGGGFFGAFGTNTGVPSHMCLGYTYDKSSVMIDLNTKKVAIGAGTLSPGGAVFSEALTVDGKVQADGFKTESGTSTQFLKADGSVDNTIYAQKSELDTISESIISTISAKGTAPLTLSASKDGNTVNITGSVSVGTGASQVAAGNHTHSNYAPLASPTFTGTPKAPTASTSTNSTQIATTAYVKSLLNESLADLEGSLVYKGTIGTSGTVTSLPANHTVGWVYVVATAGSYAGETCEVGDMIICVTTGTSANNAHWTVVQTNINGAVTGPSSSIDGQVAVFNGSTGKVIKAVNASTLSVGSATNWTEKPSWIGSSKPTYTASEIGALADDETAVSAEKVENSLSLSINSGTTEGTNKYTFNGSAAKSLNIVAGSNVTLTPSAGKLTISSTNTTYDVYSDSNNGLVPSTEGIGGRLLSSTNGWKSPIQVQLAVNGTIGSSTGMATMNYDPLSDPINIGYKRLQLNCTEATVQIVGDQANADAIVVDFPSTYPNPNALTITNGKGKGLNASYTGSAAVTAEIPNTAFPLEQTYYTGNKTIEGGNIYYPSSTTTSAVTFTIGTFTDDDPDAIIIVYGTRQVTFSGTGVYKMKNLPLTGSAGCYRVYCLSRMNTYQSNYGVYINCAEYESI